MRRGAGGYATPGARAAAEPAEAACEPCGWLTRCCDELMSCLDVFFGCSPAERAPSPRLRRAPTAASGERLLPENDASLEPPPLEARLVRPPPSPPTPTGGVAMEPLAVEPQNEAAAESDEDDDASHIKKACVESRPEECAFCLEDFLSPDNPALQLTCSHRFHLPCLLAWEQRSRNCPCCNAPMVHPALGLG